MKTTTNEKAVTKIKSESNMSPKKMQRPLVIVCEPNRVSTIVSKSTALKLHGYNKYSVLKRAGEIKKLYK